MDEIDWLRAAARQSYAPPTIDVTDDVLRTLREGRPPQSQASPMLITIALMCWGLAIVSIVVAQQMLSAWQDPLAALLRF